MTTQIKARTKAMYNYRVGEPYFHTQLINDSAIGNKIYSQLKGKDYLSVVDNPNVAEVIISQLEKNGISRSINSSTKILVMSGQAQTVFGTWNADQFMNMGDGLKFYVNARKFQGWVYIVYREVKDVCIIFYAQIDYSNWDNYGNWVLCHVSENVLYEDLVAIIDSVIETDYSNED